MINQFLSYIIDFLSKFIFFIISIYEIVGIVLVVLVLVVFQISTCNTRNTVNWPKVTAVSGRETDELWLELKRSFEWYSYRSPSFLPNVLGHSLLTNRRRHPFTHFHSFLVREMAVDTDTSMSAGQLTGCICDSVRDRVTVHHLANSKFCSV